MQNPSPPGGSLLLPELAHDLAEAAGQGVTPWPRSASPAFAPGDLVIDHAACTLRDLGAAGVTTRTMDTPLLSGVCAVRSAGYFTAARLRMWAQFSTYVAGSEHPGMGRLVHHSLFVVTQRRTQLSTDIASLSDTVQSSFSALLDARR